jgi:hypothetical protein
MTTPDTGAGTEPSSSTEGGLTTSGIRGGHSISINMEALRALYPAMRHHPAVLAALDAKAAEMAAEANALATEDGAEYRTTLVADWPDSSRARANIWTGNNAARLDEAKNSTLLKVLAHHGGEASE